MTLGLAAALHGAVPTEHPQQVERPFSLDEATEARLRCMHAELGQGRMAWPAGA